MLLLGTLIMLALFVTEGEACGRRQPPPPPPPPPPPGQPDAPPVPPPIVKVVREREQEMTRNNCKQVAIQPFNSDALAKGNGLTSEQMDQYAQSMRSLTANQCLNAENFQYECEFSVYSEIALTVIYHPTGCGCAFTISVVKPRPRKPDVAGLMAVNAAFSTKVTKFAIAVYDVEANQIEAEIPAFSNMALNANTTDLIEKAVAADPNGDFSTITAGFAGTVKEFPNLPPQLNKNDPKNKNFVPAIVFTIKQIYTTGAMFVVPCTLEMHTAPNAYMSQCQPYRADAPFAYAKRHALDAEQTAPAPVQAWFREFLLFPKQQSKCGNSGYEPKSRYITSFYNDVDCKHSNGYLSFDREFESTFEASNAVVGGWKWSRNFDAASTRVVFGVPRRFSPLTAVWCLGYSQIEWVSPSGFGATQVPVTKGVCKALPTAGWASNVEATKYKESHASYPMAAGVDCAPAYKQCPSDVTLLAFQNENPRDFSKKEDSVLLTGPRRAFCTSEPQDGAERVVFDTLTFRGVAPGEALAKRNEDDSLHKQPHHMNMVYDPLLEGLVHARHAPELVAATNEVLRKRAEKQIVVDPIAAPPQRDEFAMVSSTGSVDANGRDGKGAGDHPLRKFPETYAAPLTMDPVQSAKMEEPLIYDGKLVTGTPLKFCSKGDLGCSCRDKTESQGECNAPYECNTLSYCARPECPMGKAGCKVNADNKCDEDLIVEDGFCVKKPACTAGTIGCLCTAESTCADGECLDSRCIRASSDICTPGTAGCPCGADEKCNGGSSCDGFSGLCLFDSCTAGSAGCRCSKIGAPCSEGFACSAKSSCVAIGCTLGDAGCKCLASKKCNKRGFKCVDLDTTGGNNMCVGEDLCANAPDMTRCENECGKGNVVSCPKCTYAVPICRDSVFQTCSNKNSYLYGTNPELCEKVREASASTVTVALASLVVIVAALF
jgi:hypothetical protein